MDNAIAILFFIIIFFVIDYLFSKSSKEEQKKRDFLRALEIMELEKKNKIDIVLK